MSNDFEQTLLRFLRMPGAAERFMMPPGAVKPISAALRRDLACADAPLRLHRALALITAFAGPLESPTVAEFLREILRGCSQAVDLIQKTFFGRSALDRARGFAISEGRGARLRAPVFGSKAPPRTIALRQLLQPGAVSAAPGIEQRKFDCVA